MTCFKPIEMYLRRDRPIDFNNLREEDQKYYNKGVFSPRKNYYKICVPCGRCIGCRLDHANDWATRCALEAKNWKHNIFVTLTYNNEVDENGNLKHLPLTKDKKVTLRKKDIQDFMKRLRWHMKGEMQWENPKNGKIENPIRYFACGEYGPTRGRPHYHMAIFNLFLDDLKFYKLNKQGDMLYTSKKLSKIWGKGFAIIGELTYKSASYIARYVIKKAGLPSKTRWWKYDNKTCTRKIRKKKNVPEEEFVVMSTGVGLGRVWWEQNKEFCKKWGHIMIKVGDKVKLKPICKYFKKLWEKEDWYSYEVAKWENIKKGLQRRIEILKQVSYTGDEDTQWEKYLKTQHEILLSKAKFLRRDNFEENQ